MTGVAGRIIATVFLLAIWTHTDLPACTSFMLETEQGLYYVHSLNQGNAPGVPGLIFINQRDAWKDGYSWESLIDVSREATPNLVWQSRYGSVTFNPFGKELPDGGVNEAGLFIWEMSFDTQYPSDSTKPMLFQCQWMQYVLDNFSTTRDVIANAKQMALDGWGWHYFVADASGQTAVIDFVDGKPVVYSGSDMPVPLCCNSSYSEATKWLEQHEGFGGELAIQPSQEEIPRFIYGAKLLADYDAQDPVDYSFHVLSEMSSNVRWSVVYDVTNSTTYFNTNLNSEIRSFAVSSADFESDLGPRILNIEHPGRGDIKGEFVQYNREMNSRLLADVFELMADMVPEFRTMLFENNGTDANGLAEHVSQKLEQPTRTTPQHIQGEWTGVVAYPSSDGWMEVPMTLTLHGDDDNLSGTMDDGKQLKDVPTTNTAYKGGLLTFSVAIKDAADLMYYELHTTVDELEGSIQISSTARRGWLQLSRATPVAR